MKISQSFSNPLKSVTIRENFPEFFWKSVKIRQLTVMELIRHHVYRRSSDSEQYSFDIAVIHNNQKNTNTDFK